MLFVRRAISETSVISPPSTLVRNALLFACCDGATFNPTKVSLCSKRPTSGGGAGGDRDEYQGRFAIHSFLWRERRNASARRGLLKAGRRVSLPDIKNVRKYFARQSPREKLAKVARWLITTLRLKAGKRPGGLPTIYLTLGKSQCGGG